MKIPPKAPPVYKPSAPAITAPPAYKSQQASNRGVQLKPANHFRTETRPAPPAYRPQTQATQMQGRPGSDKCVVPASAMYRPARYAVFAATVYAPELDVPLRKLSTPVQPVYHKPANHSTQETRPAPPVYRPNQANAPSAQLKRANNFRLETRAAPQVYHPQQVQSGVQPKPFNNFKLEIQPAPPGRQPQRGGSPAVQLKPANNFRLETKPAPTPYQVNQDQSGVHLKPGSNFRLEPPPAPPAYRPVVPVTALRTLPGKPTASPAARLAHREPFPFSANTRLCSIVQQASKKPDPRSKRIPIYTLEPRKSEFEQLYRMLDEPAVEYYEELADRMSQAIHINSNLMNRSSKATFPLDIQGEYWNVLERHRGLHIGSVPSLIEGWGDLEDNYGGSKTGKALYAHFRKGFKVTLDSSDVDFGAIVKKPPEVHHLLYKAIYPDYATEKWNLMVATRGGRSEVGQHEGIFHILSAARQGNIYQTLVPAAERLLLSWAGQAPSFYPAWEELPSYFLPIVKEWSSLHFGPPMLPAPVIDDPGEKRSLRRSRRKDVSPKLRRSPRRSPSVDDSQIRDRSRSPRKDDSRSSGRSRSRSR